MKLLNELLRETHNESDFIFKNSQVTVKTTSSSDSPRFFMLLADGSRYIINARTNLRVTTRTSSNHPRWTLEVENTHGRLYDVDTIIMKHPETEIAFSKIKEYLGIRG